MKISGTKRLVLATVAVCISVASLADDRQQPTYISVECMKSTSPDYRWIESEIWLPMHQHRVEQGKQQRWALYWVMYGDRSRCDFYTVTTYVGSEQLNAYPLFDEVFAAVHSDRDFERSMARTFAARQQVASELWQMVDAIPPQQHRFAIVNRMNASDPDAYERMESGVFKPGHQALVDGGFRKGWSMYSLLSPLGTAIPYNYSTVDFVDHLDPVPMAAAMLSANPGRDLDAMQDLLDLREQVSSETWALVVATKPKSKEE